MSDRLSNDLAALRIQRDDAPPSNRTSLWIGMAVVLLIALGAALGYRQLSARVFKTEITATTIQLVSPSEASAQLTATGYLVAQRGSRVAAQIPGRIAEVLVKEGERVRRGQPLVRLDDRDERVALAGARARLGAARAALAGLERQLSRARELLQGGAGQRSTVEDLDAKVKEQAASVQLATTDLQAATVRLAETTIESPMDGVLMSKPRQVGEFVDPGTEPVAEVRDFASLMVEVDVPEGRLSKIKPGAPAEIVLDAYPDRPFRGEVAEIIPRVDRAKATVPVKIRFVDPADGGYPDMAARVSFLAAPLDPAALHAAPRLIVPAAAVVERGGGKAVFVIDEGHVRLRPVVLGEQVGQGYVVTQGPPSGTRVVASPPDDLVDGAPVQERTDV
jgi:RND family efflux transporter MFP subunit